MSISAVGDIIMGSTPQLPPDGGRHLFDGVTGKVPGTVALANMDQALTDDAAVSKCGATSSDCYAFRTPPGYAQWLHQAGFTIINLANNHSHDFGDAGLRDTQAALTAHGLLSTGLPGQITVEQAGPVRVPKMSSVLATADSIIMARSCRNRSVSARLIADRG